MAYVNAVESAGQGADIGFTKAVLDEIRTDRQARFEARSKDGYQEVVTGADVAAALGLTFLAVSAYKALEMLLFPKKEQQRFMNGRIPWDGT